MALPRTLLRPFSTFHSIQTYPLLSIASHASSSTSLQFAPLRASFRPSTTVSSSRPRPTRTTRLPSRSYATVVVHSKPKSRLRRGISFLVISGLSFGLGAYYAIHYAPPVLSAVLMGSHVPTDQETLSMYDPPDQFSREIDEHIKNSALAQSLRNDPSWRESRPYLKIPEAVRQHNLTAGTLSGPSMIVVPPYHFNKKDGSEMVQIMYIGTDVSGHPGIVHGGFIATMMDEGLARCAFEAMQNKVGVTANLVINYRKPTMAGQFLVLRATTTKVEGRKAWAHGWIESMEVAEGEQPEKLVEADALFVEPKHAKVKDMLFKAEHVS